MDFDFFRNSVGLGILLSMAFIGPIFFLLIETSFNRGPRHALSLDFGVITADILCIIAAYFASDDLVNLIDNHPGFYRITALIIFIYALYMLNTKTKMHIAGEEKLINQNYFRTFINGFLLNILNIGVVLFWLVTVISVRNSYPKTNDFMLYIALVISTYLSIDLMKIFLAKQFHYKLTEKLTNIIRKSVGIILIIFSLLIFLQSFKKFNQFNKRLEKAEQKEHSLQH